MDSSEHGNGRQVFFRYGVTMNLLSSKSQDFRRKALHLLRRQEPAVLYMLAAVAACLFMAWFFFELADDVLEGDTEVFDRAVLLWLRQDGNPSVPAGPGWLLQAARDITALGGHTVLTLLTLLAVGYCAMHRRFGTLALLLMASVGGMLLSSMMKWGFGRTRPDIVPHMVEVSTLSFPSGHAMLSAAIYVSLAVIIAQTLKTKRARIYIISTALLFTGLIGLSRVYLGVHYPSDVAAGWAVGLAWAIFCCLMAYCWRMRTKSGTSD